MKYLVDFIDSRRLRRTFRHSKNENVGLFTNWVWIDDSLVRNKKCWIMCLSMASRSWSSIQNVYRSERLQVSSLGRLIRKKYSDDLTTVITKNISIFSPNPGPWFSSVSQNYFLALFIVCFRMWLDKIVYRLIKINFTSAEP